jgi:hypothetical protein
MQLLPFAMPTSDAINRVAKYVEHNLLVIARSASRFDDRHAILKTISNHMSAEHLYVSRGRLHGNDSPRRPNQMRSLQRHLPDIGSNIDHASPGLYHAPQPFNRLKLRIFPTQRHFWHQTPTPPVLVDPN